MAFADPQSLTIGSDPGTISLPRISTGNNTSVYQTNDGTVKLQPSSNYLAKKSRRVARIDRTIIVPDEILPATNVERTGTVYVVLDFPTQGFDVTEQADMYKALVGNLAASTYANLGKLIGGEN